MPISITLPAPGTFVGPGSYSSFQSDFIGPLPAGTFWHLKVTLDPEGGQFLLEDQVDAGQSNSLQGYQWLSTQTFLNVPVAQPAAQTPVHILAELATPTSVIDTGRKDVVWDPVAPLPWQIWRRTETQVSGGFTESDRLQLQAVETRSQVLGEPTALVAETASGPVPFTLADLFSRRLLDTLTLEEVTSGPTCEPVRATFSIWYYGVVVRVTTIDPALVPRTPDAEWYFPDLAVLRMFRGQDLRYRRGIHTPTFQTDPPFEWGWNIRNLLEMLGGPPAETLAVDWRPGCCGQVYLIKYP